MPKRGYKQTLEHIAKCKAAKQLDKHVNWRHDDKIGYHQLHKRIRKMLVRPELCQKCSQAPTYDLHNITGKYNMEFKNWMWLCRRCHNMEHHSVDMTNRICSICGGSKVYPRKERGGRPQWRYIDGQLVCGPCRNKYQYNLRKIKNIGGG